MAKRKNEITIKVDSKNVMKELEKEINDDYKQKVKEIAKKKVKEIRMLEITLEKAKKELDNLLSGKSKITEEDLLFND